MRTLIWCNRLAFCLLILGSVILAMAFTLQPKISDDLYILWSFQKSPSTSAWLIKEYNEMTGRGWIILLTTFVSPYPFLETTYRAFIVIEIALLGALAWYCALGCGAWRRTTHNLQAMAIFGTLLWFALPARNETVAWLVGNFAYLVPALFGLAFIAWLEYSAVPSSETKLSCYAAHAVVSFLLGVCAGVSHEQVVAACVTYLALFIFPVSRRVLLERRHIGMGVWVGAIGLLIGTGVLVSAPSNYARAAYFAAPGLKELFERMVLYLSGAYFDLGTETTGKFIWLGALAFVLLFFNRNVDKREIVAGLKRGIFWWIISIVTLLAMAPASNFISTRTTFFAVIFLYIGIAAMTCSSQSISESSDGLDGRVTGDESAGRFALSAMVLIVLSGLVAVEGSATFISNASVATEIAKRDEIVRQAVASMAAGDKSPILVPFIATQTATLTYIQNPQHDSDFLYNWGKEIGRPIQHNVSDGAPLPNSVSPLKAIKFRHRD